jgi:hypothetical protein
MTKDPDIESHIADSKVKIENAAPETIETERHIDRTQRALERSRELLEGARDPLQFKPKSKAATAAVEDPAGPAPEKLIVRKFKPKRRR